MLKKKQTSLYIIGGRLKGRKIKVCKNKSVRPTQNKIRETLFNWLALDIENKVCLDFFAGSGILGFEAYSRGANKVFMQDKSKQVVDVLNENVLNLNTKDIVPICYEFKLGNNSFFKKYLNDYKFDIVFLDPPFDSNLVEEASIFLEEKNCLTKDALVYVEIQKAKKISLPNNWECLKEKTSGDVYYLLFPNL